MEARNEVEKKMRRCKEEEGWVRQANMKREREREGWRRDGGRGRGGRERYLRVALFHCMSISKIQCLVSRLA